jgi:zinc transport system permease protein
MNFFNLLSYDFVRFGLFSSISVALACPLVGIFLVHKRQANLADTLAHSSLIGVVLAVWFGIYSQIIIALVCILAAVLVEFLNKKNQLNEAILVIILSGSLAIATILNRVLPTKTIRLESFLFGDLNIISKSDMFGAFLVLAVTFLVFIFASKKWFVMILGLDLAHTSGVKTFFWNLVLAINSALVVTTCIKITGALLTSALIVIPVLTASNIAYSFKSSLFLSLFISVIGVFLGLIFALIYNLPSGASIVLVLLTFFILSKLVPKFAN